MPKSEEIQNESNQKPIHPNPYVGPRPFTKDYPLFGRDNEILELIDLLIAERIVLLYSPSGAGKTSLIQATLIPRLKELRFDVLPVIRVNQTAVESEMKKPKNFNRYIYSTLLSIEKSIPREKTVSPKKLVELTLPDFFELTELCEKQEPYDEESTDIHEDSDIKRSNESPPRKERKKLFIFDQFEEIITLNGTDADEKDEFFKQLGNVLSNYKCWALFSMREDFIAALDPYVKHIPKRFKDKYRLDLLDERAATLAIKGPVEKRGVKFTDEAAKKLTVDLAKIRVQLPDGNMTTKTGPYIEPVQLQVVCYELWENLPQDSKEITAEYIQETGDVNDALANYYARKISSIAQETGENERDIRDWFNDVLITEQGIRGQALFTQNETNGLKNSAIERLVNAHIIRPETRRGAIWYELAHDRLIEPVLSNNEKWFKQNLHDVQRQARLWKRQNKPERLLFNEQTIDKHQQWFDQTKDKLTSDEVEFWKQSVRISQEAVTERKELKNKAKKRTVASLVALLLFLLASVFGVIAMQNAIAYKKAEEKALEKQKQAENEQKKTEVALKELDEKKRESESNLIKAQKSESEAKQRKDEAEEQRVLAETAQKEEEKQRVIAEDALATAETKKEEAENSKNDAENQRKLAEAARIYAETKRKEADEAKVKEEGQRKLAEAARIYAETKRKEADEAKVKEEGQRKLAEAALLIAETKRKEAETAQRAVESVDSQFPYILYTLRKIPADDAAFNSTLNNFVVLGEKGISVWQWNPEERKKPPQIKKDFWENSKQLSDLNIDLVNPDDELFKSYNPKDSYVFAAISQDNKYVAAAEKVFPEESKEDEKKKGGLVHIWDLAGNLLATFNSPKTIINHLSFSPDGKLIVTAGEDGFIKVWDWENCKASPAECQPVWQSPNQSKPVNSAVFDDTGERILIILKTHNESNKNGKDKANLVNGIARIWNWKQCAGCNPIELSKHTSQINDARFSENGELVVTASEGGSAIVWDSRTGKKEKTLRERRGLLFRHSPRSIRMDVVKGLYLPMHTAAFSRDNNFVVTSSDDQTARIWDVESGSIVRVFRGHALSVLKAEFGLNDNFVITLGEDKTIRIWNACEEKNKNFDRDIVIKHAGERYSDHCTKAKIFLPKN